MKKSEFTTEEKLKELVKEKYGKIAEESTSCCDTGCCGGATGDSYSVLVTGYEQLEGYVPEADLGLGCGMPTEFAQIKSGDTVLDLGSGAGNDCFIARSLVGENGKVIGVDMTEAMIARAQQNTQKLGYTNVSFHLGDIEALPLEDSIADVVVSNCVLNLVPNKQKAFQEIYRTLKPGGHFSISDIVTQGTIPQSLQNDMELYVGCVAGAMDQEAYLQIIREIGFQDLSIQKSNRIGIPREVLQKHLSESEIGKELGFGIYSLHLFARKPL